MAVTCSLCVLCVPFTAHGPGLRGRRGGRSSGTRRLAVPDRAPRQWCLGSPGQPPTLLSLSVSPAAQWHEAVHERLPQPQPGWHVQLCGQWRRAAPRGQPGTPPVQPHRLEEEKTHTHEGQPACQSEQIIAPTAHPGPLLFHRLVPGGLGAQPGTETSIQHVGPGPSDRPPLITLHVPCVVVTSILKNSSLCSSVKPY